MLVPVAADDPNTKTNLTAFRQELERLGWLEQRNLHIDYRFAAGRSDLSVPLAQELIALQPEVILAQATEVAATLQRESRTIPIVFSRCLRPDWRGLCR